MGNNIKAVRMKIGMSRAELSRRSGVSLRTIDDWENGRKVPRDVYLIERVARALNGTIYDLINFEEKTE